MLIEYRKFVSNLSEVWAKSKYNHGIKYTTPKKKLIIKN